MLPHTYFPASHSMAQKTILCIMCRLSNDADEFFPHSFLFFALILPENEFSTRTNKLL